MSLFLKKLLSISKIFKLKRSHSVGTIDRLLRLKNLSAALQRGLFIQKVKLGHGGFWETYQ